MDKSIKFTVHRQLYNLLIFCISKTLKRKFVTKFLSGRIVRRHQRKFSILLRSFPIICFSIHFSVRPEKIIKLSSSSSIIFSALKTNSFSFTSDISPSKTEFCIQFRYFLHSFNILPTRFSPQSYTSIMYILNN